MAVAAFPVIESENGEALSRAEFDARVRFGDIPPGARWADGIVLLALPPGVDEEGRVLLRNGDRLDQEEFHRRYELCPELRRCELIEGVVYMSSPQRYGRHAEQQNMMQYWLTTHCLRHPGLESAGSVTVILGRRNEPEPDAVLFRESLGLENANGYLSGPPDLVVEIAASSRSRDYNQKMRAYAAAGIPEYIIWNVNGKAIDWFVLRAGVYERLLADSTGVIESPNFPGLRLDLAKALAGDLAGVIAALDGD